ncbi:MAG: EI24 domain-containing protein [Acidobacteria bacterium]|nr:EI24 domain-containing protein [Acidobacteriota bacterium]
MLIRHPPLFGLSLIPIVITVVLLVLLALASAWMVGELIADDLGGELRTFAQALIFVLALLLGYFFYLPVARVLLAPFSEALSRRAHTINSGGMNYQSPLGWARAMWEGLKLVMFQATIVLAALVLGLIFPPVGAPFGIAMAIFTCGLDFFDVPLSARGLPFRRKLGVIWRNKSLAIGFGIAAYLSLLIPVVNLLSLPAGVIGATLLADAIEGASQKTRAQ